MQVKIMNRVHLEYDYSVMFSYKINFVKNCVENLKNSLVKLRYL